MPLQISPFGKMPLQKSDLEICHSNFFIPLSMPFWLLQNNIQTTILSSMYKSIYLTVYGLVIAKMA
jgi:hypothetical protein